MHIFDLTKFKICTRACRVCARCDNSFWSEQSEVSDIYYLACRKDKHNFICLNTGIYKNQYVY